MSYLRAQTWVALLLAAGSWLAGPVPAYSSLAGSLAVYVPAMIFTALVLRKVGGGSAEFLRTAMLAEFGKLALTGVLCALVFVYLRPLAPGFFFLGMIGVLVAGWFGLAKMFSGPVEKGRVE